MASLRDTVKDYQDELRDGIAWVAFWKQGRSWNAEYFHLDMDDTLYPVDRSRLEEIKSTDPAAPIAAASVGEARPSMIEPRTAKIITEAGTKAVKVIFKRSALVGKTSSMF